MLDSLYNFVGLSLLSMAQHTHANNGTTNDSGNESSVIETWVAPVVIGMATTLVLFGAGCYYYRKGPHRENLRNDRNDALNKIKTSASNHSWDLCIATIKSNNITSDDLSTLVSDAGYTVFHYAARDGKLNDIAEACSGDYAFNFDIRHHDTDETPLLFALKSKTPQHIIEYYASNTNALIEHIRGDTNVFFQQVACHLKKSTLLNKLFSAIADAFHNNTLTINLAYENTSFLLTALQDARVNFINAVTTHLLDVLNFNAICNYYDDENPLPLQAALLNDTIDVRTFQAWYEKLLYHTNDDNTYQLYQKVKANHLNQSTQLKLALLESMLPNISPPEATPSRTDPASERRLTQTRTGPLRLFGPTTLEDDVIHHNNTLNSGHRSNNRTR